MKHYFLAGLLAFICTGCLGDILDEDGSLYSDTDLLGTWDTTTTWFMLGGDEVHFNEMRFCMEGGKVSLCALIASPGTANEFDLLEDSASPLKFYDWSMSEAGLLSMRLEFEVIVNSGNGDTVTSWTNDYFGWLTLTKQSMAGEAEHESFIDGIPDESYAGEFLGIKQG